MQTDTWLTDTFYPDRCPLCSQPLAGGSNTCSSCGFTAHESADKAPSAASRSSNPITPIPARASAQRAQSRPGGVMSRGQSSSAGQASARSQPKGGSWQHESPSYEAASSLSALSLIISETPTAPPRSPRSTGQLEHIDEIDTVPQSSGRTRAVKPLSDRMQAIVPDEPAIVPTSGSLSLRLEDLIEPQAIQSLSEVHASPPFSHIDEIDTVPEAGSTSSSALVPLNSTTRDVAVDAASWTVGSGSTSSLAASFIAARSPRRRRRVRTFNPLDRTRWWLLRPGHMEFLLWTVGSMLLFGITFLLLLATVLSVMVPGFPISGNFPTSTVNASALTPVETSTFFTNLRLAFSGTNALAPGAEMHLQGAGFHPRSKVVFLLDGHLPLLNQRGQAASVQTNATGSFAVNLWLGQGPNWSAGSHQILARELASGHQVTLAITILASAPPPASGNGSTQNPPVASVNPTATPVAPTPTLEPPTATPAAPTPTSTQPAPTATSQPPVSPPTTVAPPAASPTKVTPATPIVTSTPGRGQSAGSSSLGNSLNTEDGNSLQTRLAHLNPLVWLIVACYFISMLLLGMAGLLRRHRH